jgi:hypothetical protein
MITSHVQFSYYRDAGHGWVAVKRSVLEKLGVTKDISKYSYQRGKMCYLEEDCDMNAFFEGFIKMFGYEPTIRVVDHGNTSWVRSQEGYRA